MKTGKNVRQPGLYSSDCCSQELHFEKDEMFPRCPRCLHLCEWDLLEGVTAQREKAPLKERPEAA